MCVYTISSNVSLLTHPITPLTGHMECDLSNGSGNMVVGGPTNLGYALISY